MGVSLFSFSSFIPMPFEFDKKPSWDYPASVLNTRNQRIAHMRKLKVLFVNLGM